MKSSRKLNCVHINELPEDIVVKILTPLPIQDAVRTSILSKKWRNTWKNIPNLVFDYKFGLQFRLSGYEYIKAIYQVLLLHRGPLHAFVLSLYFGSNHEIEQFILIALKKGVKNLAYSSWDSDHYVFPTSIFAYGQQLMELDLSYCVFIPPSYYKGFRKLVKLTLRGVFIEGGRLSRLISNCPLLEYLWFTSSAICDHLHIEAPNLEVFHFEGLCEFLYFKNTPKLKSVEIYRGRKIEKHHFEETEARGGFLLSGRLPVVEKLEVDRFYAKCLAENRAPTSLPNDLGRLKTLVTNEIFSALCLLRNAKNLEQLQVCVEYKNVDPDTVVKEIEGFSDVTFDRLREVHLVMTGLESEVEFLKLILAKSPVLERVFLHRALLLTEKFLNELPNFRHASPDLEVLIEESL